MTKKQILKLKGKTAVYIDWANVHGWKSSLKEEVNPRKLLKYLKTYKEVESINFYFGTDSNPKSKKFIRDIKKIGFKVTTKPVKYITLGQIEGEFLRKRKCDFDIEICMTVYEHLGSNYKGYIFFSGDGDFAPLYTHLIKLGKQVIVVYAKKTYWERNLED